MQWNAVCALGANKEYKVSPAPVLQSQVPVASSSGRVKLRGSGQGDSFAIGAAGGLAAVNIHVHIHPANFKSLHDLSSPCESRRSQLGGLRLRLQHCLPLAYWQVVRDFAVSSARCATGSLIHTEKQTGCQSGTRSLLSRASRGAAAQRRTSRPWARGFWPWRRGGRWQWTLTLMTTRRGWTWTRMWPRCSRSGRSTGSGAPPSRKPSAAARGCSPQQPGVPAHAPVASGAAGCSSLSIAANPQPRRSSGVSNLQTHLSVYIRQTQHCQH